jgi:HEPN domain-containing protein
VRSGDAAAHLAQAEEFLATARAALENGSWNAAVSNAAIAAIRAAATIGAVRLGGTWSGPDHAGAVDHLQRCNPEGPEAAKLLSAVLPSKNRAQYGSSPASEQEAGSVLEAATRLVELAKLAVTS